MIPDPYRTPAPRDPDSAKPQPFAWYEVAVAATLLFLLSAIRVSFALMQSEGSSRELDLAWLLVFLVPVIVWKEIAAYRRR